MKKINFTKEHESRLKELALIVLFTPMKFKGLVGTVINVYQMVHETAISSLQTILQNIKREKDKIQNLDRWSLTNYQEAKLADLEIQYEFVDLLIGYRKNQEAVVSAREKVKELKRQYAEIKQSTLTPEQQMDALKAAIEALGDSVDSPQEDIIREVTEESKIEEAE